MVNGVKTFGQYLDLVKENRRFRFLWLGQVVSLLGDWFNLIASATLIANITQSGLAIGGLIVVRMLAPFFIHPIAGVLSDRYNRRNLLIATDIARALVVLGFLFVRKPEDVWMIYVLTAIQLGISGIFFPTRTAILPDIVESAQLGAANALSSATWSVMLAIGSALGGLTAGLWGIYPAFILDSLTFLLSALLIVQVSYHPEKTAVQPAGGLRSPLLIYMNGLKYLKNNLDVSAIAMVKAGTSLTVSGSFQVLQVIIAELYFVIGKGGGISLGLIYMMLGFGTGFGPIIGRIFTGDRENALRKAVVIGYLMTAVGILIVSPLNSFMLVLLGVLLRGIGEGTNWVFSNQLLLQIVPNDVRGRVFSTEYALITLSNAISAALSGWLLDATNLGVSGLLIGMSAAVMVPAVLWGFWVFLGHPAQERGVERS